MDKNEKNLLGKVVGTLQHLDAALEGASLSFFNILDSPDVELPTWARNQIDCTCSALRCFSELCGTASEDLDEIEEVAANNKRVEDAVNRCRSMESTTINPDKVSETPDVSLDLSHLMHLLNAASDTVEMAPERDRHMQRISWLLHDCYGLARKIGNTLDPDDKDYK